MVFFIFAIRYKPDDFSTNCTSGGSIPTRPVLSSSITKAGKDDQVDQEQAAHGEHEKMTRRWPRTLVGSGEHDNSYGLQGRKTLSQREGPPLRSDLQQPGQPPLALRAPPPWKKWLAIDMDILKGKNMLNLGTCNRHKHFEQQIKPCKSSLLLLLRSAVLPAALLCFAPGHKDLLITFGKSLTQKFYRAVNNVTLPSVGPQSIPCGTLLS